MTASKNVKTFSLVFCVAFLGLIIATACSSSNVHSCSANKSDVNAWICTEYTSGTPACSATPPNTVETGDGCPGGQSGKCTVSTGAIYYYNTDAATLAGAQTGCTTTLMGTWSN